MIPIPIIIHRNVGGSFDVQLGERIGSGLCFDEMLVEVVRLTLTEKTLHDRSYLEDADYIVSRIARSAERP